MKLILKDGVAVEVDIVDGEVCVGLDLPEEMKWRLDFKNHHAGAIDYVTLRGGGGSSEAPQDGGWGGSSSFPGGYGVDPLPPPLSPNLMKDLT